ncbi:glutathione S-transferase family protein [Streptococcus porcinus]|uniref:Glutathione S-transferase, C-terminal domain protein n=1 Tax=Streptococcus porcinus str. Jelinkova 176 TaxID=873448 RepID=A0ABN0CY04_STRPO|nr:glutathione S-transferase family protein [Streptococcus porcinus]EGJ28108.1 glutathione S-transferase, C-terminal domain protein [Streptococcus porcinus str. Jelinkova 176]SQG42613.1 glutathione S-transferase [Streptococcus porcinus]
MGLLVDGNWQDKWYDTKSTGGHFVRSQTQFRNWITNDGSLGPTGDKGFKAESGRYHLYVSLACPWASRTLMMRKLKGLEDHISLSIVNPYMLEHGWTFDDYPGVIFDPEFGSTYLYELYLKADPHYSGRVTVPVLWDKKTKTIVNNESEDIIRIFNHAFDDITGNRDDYYPEDLQDKINEVNDFVYRNINNGVYKVGFATKQEVYDKEVQKLFQALGKVEQDLEGHDWLVGNQMTEADIRLFTTLVRFDSVYYGHFKCNLNRLVDYPNLWNYTKRIYNLDGIESTVNMDHIKTHYYGSHKTINPNGIIPKGPMIDWSL